MRIYVKGEQFKGLNDYLLTEAQRLFVIKIINQTYHLHHEIDDEFLRINTTLHYER